MTASRPGGGRRRGLGRALRRLELDGETDRRDQVIFFGGDDLAS